MDTETIPDGRRAGATWVAATGAFLLLAAAAVFIAVRWDTLPDAAKLAVVGALTGGFLAGGRALRRALPATGDVLFHLGAFLLPVDAAGYNLRLGLGWRALVLVQGVVGVLGLGGLAAATGSVVLGWAGAVSVVVLAAGIAACTSVPAPLLLALAASLLQQVPHVASNEAMNGRRRLAVAWAAVAGLAPVLGVAARGVVDAVSPHAHVGQGVLVELGLAGRGAGMAAIVSGVLAAVVLGREAHRRHDLALAALAGLSLATSAGTAWVAAEPSTAAWLLVGPALFVTVEVIAMLVERDPFWRRAGRAVGLGTELLAVTALPSALLFMLLAPIVEEGLDLFSDGPGWKPNFSGGMSFALLAAGWVLAALRRKGTPVTNWTAVFVATSAIAAVEVGTASTIATAAAIVAVAAALVASRTAVGTMVATTAALWAPVAVGHEHPAVALPVGLAAALVLVWAAARETKPVAVTLASVAAAVVLEAAAFAQATTTWPVALLVVVAGVWLLAALLDAASAAAAMVLRATALVAVVIAAATDPDRALPVAFAATLLFVVDSIRRDDPNIGLGAAAGAQALVIIGARDMQLDLADTGVALCVAAVVAAGLAAVASERWRLPFVTAAVLGVTAGLAASTGDGARFAEAILLTGGIVIAAGLFTGNGIVAHAGGAMATIGLFIHLDVGGVVASEPFTAPVALQLAIAGWQLRRRPSPASSWVAYGPAVALLGGAAVAERLQGGPAWHGLVAGAVGAIAVAAGGWWRLAAPLFLGTALVVTATVVESLSTLAGVPTWAWLAFGGAALLGTGVALEQHATSPADAGRRLVDVVCERFD